MFLGFGSGRGFSHTLMFALIIYVITYFIFKRTTLIANSITIGIIFHLILDLPEIPLFYPLINYQFYYEEDPFGSWLQSLLYNPLVQITEIIGIIFLIIILVHNKLYSIKKILIFVIDSNIAYQWD